MFKKLIVWVLTGMLALAAAGNARADFHIFQMTEFYSNANGTIQYIEFVGLADFQEVWAGHSMTSTNGVVTNTYNFTTNLPSSSTSGKSVLVATQGFANLGIVTPDYIIPDGFLFTSGGTVSFPGMDSVVHAALPTDGILSINRSGVTAVNSPRNFAGVSGAVPAPAAPFAYITNRASNNVSVIDTATNTVVATVEVESDPYGVAVNPTGTRVYVANRASSNVSVIDTATHTVVATVAVGGSPYGVAVNPAGTRAYVPNANSGDVSVIDTASNTVVATVAVGSDPAGVAVNPAGTRAYVANRTSGDVSVIDTASNTVVATVAVGSNPFGVAVNPAGTRAYVANILGTVSVIDTATNTEIATVAAGANAQHVAVNPAGTRAYVANGGSANVSVIDTATGSPTINTVVATVALGNGPLGVAVNATGTRVYVANQNSNNVSVIDTATNTVVATVAVGTSPAAFGLFIGGPSATVPGAPTIGTATAGNAQATIAFTPPAWDGRSPITSYTVTSNPGAIIATGAASPITVSGLTNGTAYTFTVTATNAVGAGPASAASNSVTPAAPATVPGAPTGATATAGNAQATVTFSAPASNGGSAITGYTVVSNPAGGVDSNAGTTGLSHVITGLTNGVAYTFTVTAQNAVGTSAPSTSSNSVTPAPAPDTTPPSIPAGLSASAVSGSQINLSWTASNDNVGVDHYHVYRGGIMVATLTGSPPATTYADLGLAVETPYSYTVNACDAAENCSAPSGAASATTLASGSSYTANLESGFNLIGNSLNITIDVAATFGNQGAPVAGITPNIITIWKWNAVAGRWAFYSPQLTVAGIASFAASKNYDVLVTINPGEGYWVNALGQMTLPAQTGADFIYTGNAFAALPSGFNLIAQAATATPSQFNNQVSETPPAQGVIPTTNFVSLWAWDAVAGTWYFYSPLLESSGGLPAVKSYADSHFYRHFQDYGKTIGLGTGFWVNRP